jgi:hypothetical protein
MTSWWTDRGRPDRSGRLLRLIFPGRVAERPRARFLPLATPESPPAANVSPHERLLDPEVVPADQPPPRPRNLDLRDALVPEQGSVSLEGLVLDQESRPASWPKTSWADNGAQPLPPRLPRERAPASAEPSQPPLVLRLASLLQPPLQNLLARQGPVEWPRELFPYQRAGIRALVERDAVLLADDMGLGKTVQAIAALRILFHTGRIDSALLVVPAGLVGHWQRALREWGPELRVSTVRGRADQRAWQWRAPVHVHLTSYEMLREDFGESLQSPPRRRVWGVVVLDEAQKIKNREAEITRVCKRIPRRRAWALTGTPLENSVDDLASVCEFLTPWEEGVELRRLTPGADLLALHSSMQVRRKKAEVLPDLPPKTVTEIALDLAPAQRESYLRAEREGVLWLKELGRDVRIAHVLELITRLKQICNFCPSTGESAKLADVESRLETLVEEGHRALVFSQFVEPPYGVRAIARRLHRFAPLIYAGDQSAGERDRVIATFKSRREHKALVLSLRAGGQGLNLQEASYVFHFDRWWNPAVERQAEDRTHRLGQTVPVTVYKYVCEGTIEERIDEVLRGKQALFDELVDDVSIDLGRYLTSEELFGLFGLEPPPGARVEAQGLPPAFSGLSGEDFERYVGDLLRALGWLVETTPRTRDGGVDLKARKADQVGVETILYVQCKKHRWPVGVEVVRELNGVLDTGVRGAVACPGGFTREATDFAKERGILLWDGRHLAALEREARAIADLDSDRGSGAGRLPGERS